MASSFAKAVHDAMKDGSLPLQTFGGAALGDSWIEPMAFVNR